MAPWHGDSNIRRPLRSRQLKEMFHLQIKFNVLNRVGSFVTFIESIFSGPKVSPTEWRVFFLRRSAVHTQEYSAYEGMQVPGSELLVSIHRASSHPLPRTYLRNVHSWSDEKLIMVYWRNFHGYQMRAYSEPDCSWVVVFIWAVGRTIYICLLPCTCMLTCMLIYTVGRTRKIWP